MHGSSPTVLCGSLSLHAVRLGQAMHMAGYRALGLDYVYVPFELPADALPDALRGMRALGIRGFGVSMPFKLEILPHLDELSTLARRIGAVNTVVNEQGRLVGHNTDAAGACAALGEVTEVRGRRVLVIGAGGAARAVAYGLLEEGAEVTLANRTAAKARALAAEIQERAGAQVAARGIDEIADLKEVGVLVNASAAGMEGYGADSPVPVEWLHSGLVVMDIVYKPIHTRLVRAAKGRGLVAVSGERMLLYQAARQFELYTCLAPPVGAMDRAMTALFEA